MGIDVMMEVVFPHDFDCSHENILQIGADLHRAFPNDVRNIGISKSNWNQPNGYDIEIIGRYWSVDYQRGHFPTYAAIALWFYSRFNGVILRYGGDGGIGLSDVDLVTIGELLIDYTQYPCEEW